MANKLTVADLISRKEQIKKKSVRKLTLYVGSLDGEITIQEPSRDIAMETLEMAQDPARSDKADIHVVYHCVIEPNLKDKELQQEFGCTEPTDIVTMLFRPGEITSISSHILELAGFKNGVRAVDNEIKN